jgi:hypothetical protein
MAREQEDWGGEVRLPGWLRRLLRRPDPEVPAAEVAHEARKARSTLTAEQKANANRTQFTWDNPRRKWPR